MRDLFSEFLETLEIFKVYYTTLENYWLKNDTRKKTSTKNFELVLSSIVEF